MISPPGRIRSRRYHACAVALAQTLGLAVAEVLREHRESVTAVFNGQDLEVLTGARCPQDPHHDP
jgi:hypothetical protein